MANELSSSLFIDGMALERPSVPIIKVSGGKVRVNSEEVYTLPRELADENGAIWVSTYGPTSSGWTYREHSGNPPHVVIDEGFQQARNEGALHRGISDMIEGTTPGAILVTRLHLGREDMVSAEVAKQVLLARLGTPLWQQNVLFPLPNGQARVDWIGVLRLSSTDKRRSRPPAA